MRRILFHLGAAILFALLLSNCSSVPGETLASTRLQHDLITPILAMDMVADPACKNRAIVNTEILARSATERTERWTVNRCGKLVRYLVILTPSPMGGTDYDVSREPGN